MTDEELETKVAELLTALYTTLMVKVREISLSTICTRNATLLRAVSKNNHSSYFDEVLNAFISSQEETLFRAVFFEPLMLAARPIDKVNANAVVGGNDAAFVYCLGRVMNTPQSRVYERLAEQCFWEGMMDKSGFYIKVIAAVRDLPEQYHPIYIRALGDLRARLIADFGVNFLHSDGTIHWERLLAYNSGKDARIRLQRARVEPATNTIVLEEIPEYETQTAAASEAAENVPMTEFDDAE